MKITGGASWRQSNEKKKYKKYKKICGNKFFFSWNSPPVFSFFFFFLSWVKKRKNNAIVCVFNTRKFQWFRGGIFFFSIIHAQGALFKMKKHLSEPTYTTKSEMTICFIVVIVVLRNNLCIDVEFGKCDNSLLSGMFSR